MYDSKTVSKIIESCIIRTNENCAISRLFKRKIGENEIIGQYLHDVAQLPLDDKSTKNEEIDFRIGKIGVFVVLFKF